MAVPLAEQVVIITDHSAIFFLKDGTPCESVLLDNPITDAGKLVYVKKIFNKVILQSCHSQLISVDQLENHLSVTTSPSLLEKFQLDFYFKPSLNIFLFLAYFEKNLVIADEEDISKFD